MVEKLNGDTWSERFVLGVGSRVRARRRELRLSIAAVADRLRDELGYEVTDAVVNNLEVGRVRYVDMALLTTLAAALRCSPMALLYDATAQATPVEVLPGNYVRGWDAIGFASGSNHALPWVLRDVLSRHDERKLEADPAVALLGLRLRFEEAAEHYGRTQSALLGAQRRAPTRAEQDASVEYAIRLADREAAENELRSLAQQLIDAGADVGVYRDGRPAPRDALMAWLLTGQIPATDLGPDLGVGGAADHSP